MRIYYLYNVVVVVQYHLYHTREAEKTVVAQSMRLDPSQLQYVSKD